MMSEKQYLTIGSMAVIKARDHKSLSYGTTVTIKRMHGTTITVVPSGEEKAYFVNANMLHNNLMPYA
jgi:hypothetical protein